MLTKYPNKRHVIEFVSLDAMVPEDHLLRKIDSAINFERIYDFVEDLYCE
ncbi:MAG: IS5/IS1182 family transposase, partial [Peptococcaceae bacterium]|nr:IS5/IS1182 family transposase [Peptococcaceae bacterium]